MIIALKSVGFKEEDAREWVATGCVEPTIPGKHLGHTNSMMFNTVAALEMALNDGVHPLIEYQVGPKTGNIYEDAFLTFEDFFNAFIEQLKFMAYQTVDYNNYLGISHQVIRPTPILSSLFEGTLDKAKDVTEAGTIYNSSGVACIGLTDIVDSLCTIKKLVYDEKKVDFKELHKALEVNFEGYEKIHSMIVNKIPKFGSDHPEVNELVQRIVDSVFDIFYNRLNYRGGHYHAGYWSMSNHVAFGTLSGGIAEWKIEI
jgi:formate C-acetyltransferase